MKCKLFVIFHSKLHESQYEGDENIYTFAKVGEQPIDIKSELLKERVVVCKDMVGFVNKGKEWAESEFLISLYETIKQNPDYLGGEKFVGFMQYDHSTTAANNIKISDLVKNAEIDDNTFVSLVPIDMNEEIYSNHIAMDFSNPQKLQGDPLCYFPMIADFNKFYGTNYKYGDFIKSSKISLCSSFIMSVDNFMRMMEFCIWSSNKNNLDHFDPLRKHRMQGGLMERYYGCWLILSGLKKLEFRLKGMEGFR